MGKDFGFGYKRSGTAEMLKEMGPSLGFETEIIEKQRKTAARSAAPGHGKSWNRAIWKP